MELNARHKIITRAALVALLSTVTIVILKLVAAAISGSISVLAEGLQSLLDVFMSLMALWAVKVSIAPPDKEHPYGHSKAQLLTGAFQMILVLVSAGIIVWQASIRLYEPRSIVAEPGIGAMVLSIVLNFSVIVLIGVALRRAGPAPALEGEAEHLKADSLASLGVLAGLVAYYFTGWEPLDPLVAIVFTGVGAFFAIRQLKKVIHPLMDGSLPPEQVKLVEETLDQHSDVKGYHNLRTRESGDSSFVMLHVLLEDELSFVAAHDLAEQIEDEISEVLGGALVTVHYEPYEAEIAHRAEEHDEPPPNPVK